MDLKDKICGKPTLLPGDIVKSKKTGALLVIEKAEVVVNGDCVNWDEELPREIEHGHMPSYAAQCLPEYEEEKHAWWELSELDIVKLGPLHKYLNGVKDQVVPEKKYATYHFCAGYSVDGKNRLIDGLLKTPKRISEESELERLKKDVSKRVGAAVNTGDISIISLTKLD